MSVNRKMSVDGNKVHININGRFDYTLSEDFRNTYRHVHGKEGLAFHVDLSEANYMDSSALGMLLNMKKTLGESVSSITISNCRPQLKKILQISRFDKKFDID